MCNLQCVKTRVTGLCFPRNSDQEKQVWLPHKLIPLWDHCARLQSANSQCFAQPLRQYLVFLAGWSRRLDELLKDAQAHEGDVFNNHRSLDVHCHEEEAESCKQTGMFIILGELQTGPSSGQHPEWVQRWKSPCIGWPGTAAGLTAAQAQLPAAVLLGDGVCQQQHLVLEAAGLQHRVLQLLGLPHSLLFSSLIHSHSNTWIKVNLIPWGDW